MKKITDFYRQKLYNEAKEKYQYVNLTEEYFSWLFDRIYNLCLEKYSKFDNFNLEDIVYNLLENKIRAITVEVITKDNNYMIVNNYINKLASEAKNHRKLDDLVNYFEHLDCDIDYIQLLEENKNFSDIIKTYLEKNYIRNNHTIRMIISAYKLTQEKKETNITFDDIDIPIDYDSTELLTDQEEKKIGYEILKGNQKAKTRMLLSNQLLVKKIVSKYYYPGLFLDYEELLSEGNIGLMKAINRFDVTKGYKFSTYAIWWIRNAIKLAIANQARTIRVSVGMVEMINKLGRIQRRLTLELNREPTKEELAKELNVSIERITEILESEKFIPVSLNAKIQEDSGNEIGDIIEDTTYENSELAAIDRVFAKEVLNKIEQLDLSEEEKQVLYLRFGLKDNICRTQEQIGQKLGISKQVVNLREKKALEKLMIDPFFQSVAVNINDKSIQNKLNKIKNKHYNKSRKNICKYFGKTKEEMKEIISYLDESSILLLQSIYGLDYSKEAENNMLIANNSKLINIFNKINNIIYKNSSKESKQLKKTR